MGTLRIKSNSHTQTTMKSFSAILCAVCMLLASADAFQLGSSKINRSVVKPQPQQIAKSVAAKAAAALPAVLAVAPALAAEGTKRIGGIEPGQDAIGAAAITMCVTVSAFFSAWAFTQDDEGEDFFDSYDSRRKGEKPNG